MHGDYYPGSLLFAKQAAEEEILVTYEPGDTVPRDGTVQCTQYHGTKDKVTKGTKFAPCEHWGDHHPTGCTWQYV